jgi:hypothetical protein
MPGTGAVHHIKIAHVSSFDVRLVMQSDVAAASVSAFLTSSSAISFLIRCLIAIVDGRMIFRPNRWVRILALLWLVDYYMTQAFLAAECPASSASDAFERAGVRPPPYHSRSRVSCTP